MTEGPGQRTARYRHRTEAGDCTRAFEFGTTTVVGPDSGIYFPTLLADAARAATNYLEELANGIRRPSPVLDSPSRLLESVHPLTVCPHKIIELGQSPRAFAERTVFFPRGSLGSAAVSGAILQMFLKHAVAYCPGCDLPAEDGFDREALKTFLEPLQGFMVLSLLATDPDAELSLGRYMEILEAERVISNERLQGKENLSAEFLETSLRDVQNIAPGLSVVVGAYRTGEVEALLERVTSLLERGISPLEARHFARREEVATGPGFRLSLDRHCASCGTSLDSSRRESLRSLPEVCHSCDGAGYTEPYRACNECRGTGGRLDSGIWRVGRWTVADFATMSAGGLIAEGSGLPSSLKRRLEKVERWGLGALPLYLPLNQLSHGQQITWVCSDLDLEETVDAVIVLGDMRSVLSPRGYQLLCDQTDGFAARGNAVIRIERQAREVPAPLRREAKCSIKLSQIRSGVWSGASVEIPIGGLVCLRGEAGTGKSQLLRDVLVPALRAHKSTLIARVTGWSESRLRRVRYRDMTDVRLLRGTVGSLGGNVRQLGALVAATPAGRRSGLKAEDLDWTRTRFRCFHCLNGRHRCRECNGTRLGPNVRNIELNGMDVGSLLTSSFNTLAPVFAAEPGIGVFLRDVAASVVSRYCLSDDLASVVAPHRQLLRIAAEARSETEPCLHLLDLPCYGLSEDHEPWVIALLRELVEDGHSVVVVDNSAAMQSQSDHVFEPCVRSRTGVMELRRVECDLGFYGGKSDVD